MTKDLILAKLKDIETQGKDANTSINKKVILRMFYKHWKSVLEKREAAAKN